MPQNPLLTDQIQVEPGTTTFGTRTINRASADGSLQFADPNVTATLQQLVGVRNVTGLYLVGSAGDGSPYTSIQAAIDAIPDTSSPTTPSLVAIMGGDYTENLTIDKDGVFLIGLGATTIRNSGANSTVTISDEAATTPNKVVLQNLRIVNDENAQACVEVSGAGTFASGTVTVNTAPLAVGDSLTIGGVTLVGVSGSRDSGSDNFSVDGSTVAGIAAEITEAINDTNNSFSASVVATVSGAVVTITAVAAGVGGNSITLSASTTPAGGLTVSGATLTGGSSSGSPVGSDTIDILDCELVAEGVGGLQISANTVNNIRVLGGSWRGSSSTSKALIVQCASFRLFGVEWANDLELSYNSGNDQPSLTTSVYEVKHCGRVNDLLTNIIGVGSLTIDHCPSVGTITSGGDQTLDIQSSTVGAVALSDTLAATLVRTSRGAASVAGGTPTLQETLVGSVSFAASTSEVITFDIPQPDASYAVFLDNPSTATALAVTAKTASSFTISASPALTGTVFYTVTRSL